MLPPFQFKCAMLLEHNDGGLVIAGQLAAKRSQAGTELATPGTKLLPGTWMASPPILSHSCPNLNSTPTSALLSPLQSFPLVSLPLGIGY